MVTPMSDLVMAIQIYGGGGLIGGRGLFPDSENYLKKKYKLNIKFSSGIFIGSERNVSY